MDTLYTKSGWWFGTFLFFHMLGIIIFFRGVETTNQKYIMVNGT
jgi:hypothetical protein